MKKRNLSLCITALVVMILVTCLIACNDSSSDPNTTPQKLSTPVIMLYGDLAKWDSNANATQFEIKLDGVSSYVDAKSTTLTLTDGQELQVRAIGDGEKYLTSDWSNLVVYILPTIGEEELRTLTFTQEFGDSAITSYNTGNYGTDDIDGIDVSFYRAYRPSSVSEYLMYLLPYFASNTDGTLPGSLFNIEPIYGIEEVTITYKSTEDAVLYTGDDRVADMTAYALPSSANYTTKTIDVDVDNFFKIDSGEASLYIQALSFRYSNEVVAYNTSKKQSGDSGYRMNAVTYSGTLVAGESSVAVPVEVICTNEGATVTQTKTYTYYTLDYVRTNPSVKDTATIIDANDVAAYYTAFGEFPANYAVKNFDEGKTWEEVEEVFGEDTRYVSMYSRVSGYVRHVPYNPDNTVYYEFDIALEDGYASNNRGVGRVVAWEGGWVSDDYTSAPACVYTDDHYSTFQEYLNTGEFGEHFDAEISLSNTKWSAPVTYQEIVDDEPGDDEPTGGEDPDDDEPITPQYTDISDIHASATALTDVTVKGEVIALSNKGFLITDGTGIMMYYANALADVSVGDVVKISGSTTIYSSNQQFQNTATYTIIDEEIDYTPTTPVVWDYEDVENFDGYIGDYVEITVSAYVSGNYYNCLSLDSSSNRRVSIIAPTDEVLGDIVLPTSAESALKVVITGYPCYVTGGNVYVNILIDSMELFEEDVEECTHTYDDDCDASCNSCGEVRDPLHSYDGDCDESCNECIADRTALVSHDYISGICSVCGAVDENYEEPEVDIYTDISDIHASATALTDVTVKGEVIALSNKGFLITDGTGIIMYYANALADVSVGDVVKISGSTTIYSSNQQFQNTATYTIIDEEIDYTPTTPVVWDYEDVENFDGYIGDYVEITVSAYVSGNYYNCLSLDSSSNRRVSIIAPTDEVLGDIVLPTSVESALKVVITGYPCYVTGGNVYVNILIDSMLLVEDNQGGEEELSTLTFTQEFGDSAITSYNTGNYGTDDIDGIDVSFYRAYRPSSVSEYLMYLLPYFASNTDGTLPGSLFNIEPIYGIEEVTITYKSTEDAVLYTGDDRVADMTAYALPSSANYTTKTIDVDVDNFFKIDSGEASLYIQALSFRYSNEVVAYNTSKKQSGDSGYRMNAVTYSGTLVAGESSVAVPIAVSYDGNSATIIQTKTYTYYTLEYVKANPSVKDTATIIDANDVAAYYTAFGEFPANYAVKNFDEGKTWEEVEEVFGEDTRYVSMYSYVYGYAVHVPYNPNNTVYYEFDIALEDGYASNNRGVGRVVAWEGGWVSDDYTSAPACVYTDDHYSTFQEYLNTGEFGERFDAEISLSNTKWSAPVTCN